MPDGAPDLGAPGTPKTQRELESQWAPYVQRMQQRSEMKQAKAHERPPAMLKLARFLPRKLRAKLQAGSAPVGAEDGAAGGRYARAPAGDPDKRE